MDSIILDKSTSVMNTIAESEILKDFISLITDKAARIILHRVGLCKFVDRIVMVKFSINMQK